MFKILFWVFFMLNNTSNSVVDSIEIKYITQISRSEELHFGASYAKNNSSILRSTEDESSMIFEGVPYQQ